MKVGRAIELLQTLSPDAELMISAPISSAKSPVINTEAQSLDIPARAIRRGIFFFPHAPGTEWVMIVGTSAWGLDDGIVA